MANLFILPSHLGDAIITTGALEKYKNEPAVIVATPKSAHLFHDFPNLEQLLIIPQKPWKKHWLDTWMATKGRSWDRVIDLRGSMLSYFLKAKERYVWGSTTISVPKVLQVGHTLRTKEVLSPTLWISEERMKRVKQKKPVLAVSPIPGWLGKQWPIENFATLLNQFCKKYPDALVAVFAAPSERKLVEPLLKALPKDKCIDTIGGELLDSAALIASSKLFIGNDSGLMHLSAAVKTPTLALFGPSNEKIFGPWSDQKKSPHRTLRGEPFTGHVRQAKEDTKCYMTALKVPPVWEAVQEMWETAVKKK